MKSLSILTIGVIILALASGSHAQCGPMNSGHNLLACIESSDPQLYGYGLGFISGVTFAYRAMYDGTMKPEKICIPKGIKINYVKKIIWSLTFTGLFLTLSPPYSPPPFFKGEGKIQPNYSRFSL